MVIQYFQTVSTIIPTAYIALLFEAKYFNLNNTQSALHLLKSFFIITIFTFAGEAGALFYIFNTKYEHIPLWLSINALIFLFIYIIRIPLFSLEAGVDSEKQAKNATKYIDFTIKGEENYNKNISKFGALPKILKFEKFLYPLLFFSLVSIILRQYIILLFFIPISQILIYVY